MKHLPSLGPSHLNPIRLNPPLANDQACIIYQGCTYIIDVQAIGVKTEVNMQTEIEIRGFIQNGK